MLAYVQKKKQCKVQKNASPKQIHLNDGVRRMKIKRFGDH